MVKITKCSSKTVVEHTHTLVSRIWELSLIFTVTSVAMIVSQIKYDYLEDWDKLHVIGEASYLSTKTDTLKFLSHPFLF